MAVSSPAKIGPQLTLERPCLPATNRPRGRYNSGSNQGANAPAQRTRRRTPYVDHGFNLFCFAASYATALGLELWHQFRPRPVLRYAAVGFGAAGLLAHTIY